MLEKKVDLDKKKLVEVTNYNRHPYGISKSHY